MQTSFYISLFLVLLALSPPAAAVQVTDDLGDNIELKKPARRIVSLAPHLTEMLFAAGAGEHIVGAVDFSDFPEQAKKITRVGGYSRFDMEAIVALKPDLIVAWKTGNTVWQVNKLRAMGYTIYVSEPRRIEDIPAHIENLGRLAATDSTAQQASRRFRARHQALRRRYHHRPIVTVFYEIWNQPLMTVNGSHIISDVMQLCGGRNVFHDLPNLVPTVSVEAVMRADPQAIVASGMNEQRPDWLDDWRRWSGITAVKNDNLIFIPPDIIQRHSPRLLDGAERLCQALDQGRDKRR